ncbi:hypothetical protein V1519DRAFT_480298, partial [Lipomyces tetrasporus]
SPSAPLKWTSNLPSPPRRSLINYVEAPQSVYAHGTRFTLYSAEGNGTIAIRIQKHLQCSLASGPDEKQVVAKIFDPLFVPVDELPDIPAKFRQVVAFQCCKREVAAYSSLTSLQGNAVPKFFYGDLSCNFPHRSTESDRIAKVILMEYIDGWPLSWYSRKELTASQGRWIMQQTETILHQIHCHGVIHHDSFLRNFLLTKLGRAVIVDFEESEILDGHNRYSPEKLKKGDLMVLRGDFEDLG